MANRSSNALPSKAQLLKKYLATANRIIGTRTPAEVAYDREVIRWLTITKDIRAAIAKANQKFPAEAMEPAEDQYPDLEARYEYLRNHEQIIKRVRR